tara:strand:+ start:540 stop:1841 length:1302 start_codon:yes stop_codon:yes gene_type:complete
MKYISSKSLRKISLENYGFFLFLCGIFILPSSLFLSILLLLPAALIGTLSNKKPYLQDKWNYPFISFGILILISSLLQKFVFHNVYHEIWDSNLSLIGLGNWLPFIWLFWAFQPYVNTSAKRKSFALVLISSTFPVLITGFGQYFFNWTGPFQTLNGFIVWYQRPIKNPAGLSGLFNNQNYAGSWLNFVWPFCIAILLEKGNNFFKKAASFSFLVSVGFAAFLTFSRNAWLGIIISTPIILGKRFIKLIFPVLAFILFIVFIQIFSLDITNQIGSFLSEKFFQELTAEGYKELDVTRLDIFSSAISFIKINPIFGIGAASFSALYLLETNLWKGHSHNLLLELAISYGIPSTILLFTIINTIIFKSGKILFSINNESKIAFSDRAFWTALIFFLISQISDIQYFDGKISLIAWILMAGLKNIIEGNNTQLSKR